MAAGIASCYKTGPNSARKALTFFAKSHLLFASCNPMPPTDPMNLCIVCFDSASSAILCANQHAVCDGCCEMLVKTTAEGIAGVSDLEATAAAADAGTALELSGRLRCPCAKLSAGGCDAPPYADSHVALHVPESAFEMYVTARTLLPIAQKARLTYQDAQSALCEELGELKEATAKQANISRKLLAKQLQQQMPDARQCRECGFGPVDHMKCEDLAVHHGQDLGNGIKIDNSCKRCGWFSADHADWPVWDGTLHGDVQPSASDAEALMAQSLESAQQAAEKAEATLAAKLVEHADSAEREQALRLAGEQDQLEVVRQRKLAEQWKLEHSRAQDELANLRAREKRRQKAEQEAVVVRVAAARGWTTVPPDNRKAGSSGVPSSAANGNERMRPPSRPPSAAAAKPTTRPLSAHPPAARPPSARPSSARPPSTRPSTPTGPSPKETKLSAVLSSAEPQGASPPGLHSSSARYTPLAEKKTEPKLSAYLRAAEGQIHPAPSRAALALKALANSNVLSCQAYRSGQACAGAAPILGTHGLGRPGSAGFTKPLGRAQAPSGPIKVLHPLPPIKYTQ